MTRLPSTSSISISSATSFNSEAGAPVRTRWISRLRRTDIPGYRAGPSIIAERGRFPSPTRIVTEPSVGRTSRVNTRMVVDLPAPLRPTNAVT